MADARILIQVNGFEALAAALKRFPEAAAEVAGSAAMQGALVVQNDAKRRCPVDTGTLQRSIHSEYEDQTEIAASVIVGTDVDYGKYVEFGTSRMAAQPFLRPAVDENQPEIQKQITDTFVELANEELDSRGPRGGLRRS